MRYLLRDITDVTAIIWPDPVAEARYTGVAERVPLAQLRDLGEHAQPRQSEQARAAI